MSARMTGMLAGLGCVLAAGPAMAQAGGLLGGLSLSSLFVPVIILMLVLAFIIAVSLFTRNYIKVPPNQAAVISGRKYKLKDGSTVGSRLVRGGATFKWPVFERADYLDLTAIKIETNTREAITKEGVPLTVEAIANVKFGSEDELLRNAAERFLGKDEEQIHGIIAETLEAHLRSICGTLTVEAINSDRQEFAKKMISEAEVDLKRMGVVIDVWAVKHIQDDKGYLQSLGRARTAQVKRDADIGEAEAKRDSEIKTAQAMSEAQKKATDAKREGEVQANKNAEQIAQARRDLEVKQAKLAAEVAEEQARRDQAGPRAKAQAEKDVLVAQVQAQQAQTEAQIQLKEKEAERRRKELEATVIRDAEAARERAIIEAEAQQKSVVIRAEGDRQAAIIKAEADRDVNVREGEGEAAKIRALAEAEAVRLRATLVAQAEGDAAKIRQMGEAEGVAVRAKLLAEAEGALKKAEALRALDDAAKLIFVLDRVLAGAPNVIDSMGRAASQALGPAFDSVGKGLANIDKVTIVDTGARGGGGGVGGFANTAPNVVFNLLQNVRALGMDIEPMLKKLGINVVTDLGLTSAPHQVPPAKAGE